MLNAQEYHHWLMLADVPAQLETDHLILRIFEVEDTQEFFKQVRASYHSLSKYIHWTVETDTLEKMEQFVRTQRAKFFRREDLYYLVIKKESGAMLGYAGMHRIKQNSPGYELGYSLFEHAINKGYATEAARALVQLAFEQLNANRVAIVTQRENTRSRAVAERLGFQFELYKRHHEWNVAHTRLIDLAFYSLIRPEFETQRAEFDVLR